MAGDARDQGLGGAALDSDQLVDQLERTRALRGEVTCRVGRIELLDKHVLDVGIGRRIAPGDLAIVAEDNQWGAGHRDAGESQIGRFKPRQIPNDRRRIIEMRIVGEQRFPGDAVSAVDDPIVGSLLRADKLRELGQHTVKRLIARQLSELCQRYRRLLGVLGKQLVDLLGVEALGEACPQQLPAIISRKLHSKKLAHGETIGWPPPLWSVTQQCKLNRQLLAAIQECIDARRISTEHIHEFGRDQWDAGGGVAVEPECAQRTIGGKRFCAEHFRQAALNNPALLIHLEEPLLGVDETQSEIEILGVLRPNRGYVRRIANHRNRRGEFGENERATRPRQRTRKERPTAAGPQNEQDQDSEYKIFKPRHGASMVAESLQSYPGIRSLSWLRGAARD